MGDGGSSLTEPTPSFLSEEGKGYGETLSAFRCEQPDPRAQPTSHRAFLCGCCHSRVGGWLIQEENGSESSIWGASPSLRSEMKSAARARTVNLTGSSKEDEDLTLHSFDGVSARRMACLLSRHVRDPETYMRPVVPFMCPALVEDLKSVLPTCVVREQEFIRKLGQSKEKKAMEDLLSISLGNSTLLQTFDLGLCQVEEANKRK